MSTIISFFTTTPYKRELSSLEWLILETVARYPHPGKFHAWDSEMPELIRETRKQIYSAPLAWLLNKGGPDLKTFRSALLRLEHDHLISHHLESQDDADGHGMINWHGPAPRYRFYTMTESGVQALKDYPEKAA